MMYSLVRFFEAQMPVLCAERDAMGALVARYDAGEALSADDMRRLAERASMGARAHTMPSGKPLNFDPANVHTYFPLPQDPAPRIVIVNALTGEAVSHYSDLPCVVDLLNKSEKRLLAAHVEKLSESLHFYDGDNIVLSDVAFDRGTGVVTTFAYAAPYSLLSCRFPEESPILRLRLYKTGALAAISDGHCVPLMQRRRDGMMSVLSGFAQPTEEGALTFPGSDLYRHTAKSEAEEELVSDAVSGTKRGRLDVRPVAGISLRTTGIVDGPRCIVVGTAEMAVPVLFAGRERLESVVRTNRAPDVHEHTEHFAMFPIRAHDRHRAQQALLRADFPGVSLYLVALLAAGACFGHPSEDGMRAVSEYLGTRTWVVPAAALCPGPFYALTVGSERGAAEAVDAAEAKVVAAL